jgi:hypothetical protein
MELFIGGGVILIYLGIAIACMIWALSWARRRNFGAGRRVVTILTVLFATYSIPFGDHTIGAIKVAKLCEKDAGSNVQRVVEGVEGFQWETGLSAKPDTFGYRYLEVQLNKGSVTRYVRTDSFQVRIESGVAPISKYLVYRAPEERIWPHIHMGRFVVEEIQSMTPLAVWVNYSYEGGWLARSLKGIGATGGYCPTKPLNHIEFIHTVLRPLHP